MGDSPLCQSQCSRSLSFMAVKWKTCNLGVLKLKTAEFKCLGSQRTYLIHVQQVQMLLYQTLLNVSLGKHSFIKSNANVIYFNVFLFIYAKYIKFIFMSNQSLF